MKTIEAELFQMIKNKMSARLPQTIVAELSLETTLKDLGLDSLKKVCLLFEIDERFNCGYHRYHRCCVVGTFWAMFRVVNTRDPEVGIGSKDGCGIELE